MNVIILDSGVNFWSKKPSSGSLQIACIADLDKGMVQNYQTHKLDGLQQKKTTLAGPLGLQSHTHLSPGVLIRQGITWPGLVPCWEQSLWARRTGQDAHPIHQQRGGSATLGSTTKATRRFSVDDWPALGLDLWRFWWCTVSNWKTPWPLPGQREWVERANGGSKH